MAYAPKNKSFILKFKSKEHMEEFIKKTNENKITKEFLEECRKVREEIFKLNEK